MLNVSSTTFDNVREPMDAAISSNASFFRSSIVCYSKLRQGAGVVLVQDTNLIRKPIDRLGRGAGGIRSIIAGEGSLS